MTRRRRIDVHQHIVPPTYSQCLRSIGIADAGGRDLPDWSTDDAPDLMEAQNIATAIVSVSTPGVHLDPARQSDPVARARAREVNEFAARTVKDHPDRFGFFATLCLPDIDGALEDRR